MSSLYTLTEELIALDRLLVEAGGEVTEGTDGASLEDWLKKYEWQVGEKVDAYGGLIKNWEADIDGIKKEAERLVARAGVIGNKIKRLKEMAGLAMKMRGIRKIEGTLFTIALQKNGGKPPLIMIVEDVAKLPEQFVKRTPAPDSEAIRAALALNDPEAAKVARIGEVGESVRIR